MFGELRSILARPGLDREMWHAWLNDPAWQIERLHPEEMFSVRQMQAQRGYATFSVPDEVIRALIYGDPLPGIYVRQPERLWLCAHLELRPEVLRQLSWTERHARPDIATALSRVSWQALRMFTIHGGVFRQCEPGGAAMLLSHAMCSELESLEVWGDQTSMEFELPAVQLELVQHWVEAMTTMACVGTLRRCRVRQFGLRTEHLEQLFDVSCLNGVQHLDLSHNPLLDREGVQLFRERLPASIESLIAQGHTTGVEEKDWDMLKRERPELAQLVYSASPFAESTRSDARQGSDFEPFPSEMRITLVSSRAQGVQTHVVDSDTVLLGRHRAYRDSLCIADPSVGRMHTRLVHYRGAYYAVDLGSTNRTFIERELVPFGHAHRVEPGQNIKLGGSVIRLEE